MEWQWEPAPVHQITISHPPGKLSKGVWCLHSMLHRCSCISQYSANMQLHPSVCLHHLRVTRAPDWSQNLYCSLFFLMQKVIESRKSAASAASTLDLQVASSCICSLPPMVLNFCLQLWIPAKMDTTVISFEVTGVQPWNSQQYSCLAMFFLWKTSLSTKRSAHFSLTKQVLN